MRKSGAKIKRTLCVLPLGVKRNTYSLPTYASLLKFSRNQADDQDLANLYTASEIARRLNNGKMAHIDTHADTLLRLLEECHARHCACMPLEYAAIEASANVLLEFIYTQKNHDIINLQQDWVKKLR